LSIRELCETRTVEPELELIEPVLGQDDGALFDVGAHKGDYTYVMQRIAAPHNIYAVEPLFTQYRHLTRLFPGVRVLHLALSDHEGELDLKIPVIDGNSLPTRATLERFQDLRETRATFEKVQLQTLDRLCVTMGIEKVRYVKIDVEGHEQKVLAGAAQTIRTWRPTLQVEIEQRHHCEPVCRIFNWIVDQGYSGFFFNSSERLLYPISEFSVGRHQALASMGTPEYINNFLFLNRDFAQRTVQAVHASLEGESVQ
jgi:FkbM family methyltransferase